MAGVKVSLRSIHRKYKYFRILVEGRVEYVEGLKNGILTQRPRKPDGAMDGEDWTIPRICVGTSIYSCVAGVIGCLDPKHTRKWLHGGPKPKYIENDGWTKPSKCWESKLMFQNALVFATNEKAERALKKHVPDAHITDEHWFRKPTKFIFVGNLNVKGEPYITLAQPSKPARKRGRKSTNSRTAQKR